MKRIIFNCILIICMVVVTILPNFILPLPVHASTLTLYPIGVGSETNLTIVFPTGQTHWSCTDDDDADTRYVSENYGDANDEQEGRDLYAVTDHVAEAGIISEVIVYANMRQSASAGMHAYGKTSIRTNGLTQDGSQVTLTSSYVLSHTHYTTNPQTGFAWTWAEIDNLEVGVDLTGDAHVGGLSARGRCTYVYAEVSYTGTVPVVVTNSVENNIYQGLDYKAHLSGQVSDTGGATVDYYGFVYNTTSMADPGNVAPNLTAYSNYVSVIGDYGTSEFLRQITGLVKGQTYYYRAAAHNSLGWAYGDVVLFKALNDPTVTTDVASVVTATTARLNSTLTFNGGQDCTIQFAYARTALGPFGNYAAIAAAGTTATPTGNYTTGESPYSDISSLTAGQDYTFCVSATNTVSTQYGAQRTLLAESGVYKPTSFKGIPAATTISLVWVKGAGSTNTIIRYKTGSYPTSPTDGTSAYSSNMNSVLLSGLTIGTTYYFRAWGLSGTTYSLTGNATLMITTLAAIAAQTSFTTQSTPSYWYQSPDYTNMSAFFMYDLINWGADSFQIQRSILWFLIAITFSVVLGIILYGVSNNLVITVIAIALVMVVGVFAELISGWLLLPYVIIAMAAIMIGERR